MANTIYRPASYWTDNVIIAGILIDDRQTLNYLHKEYRPIVLSLIQRVKRPYQDTEDFLQEGMLQLTINVKRGVFKQHSKLSTYFRSICRNIIMNENRKNDVLNIDYLSKMPNKQTEEGLDEAERKRVPFDDYDETKHKTNIGNYDSFNTAFLKLGNLCIKILTMLSDEIPSAIAQSFNMTVESVTNEKYRCKVKLKKIWSNEDRLLSPPFRLVRTDINLIDNYYAGMIHDNDDQRSFFEKLKTDKNFLLEYQFVLKTYQTAKKVRYERMKSLIKSILEDEENENTETQPLDFVAPKITITDEDGKSYLSIDALIEDIQIEKSIYENRGENVPANINSTLDKLSEIKEEIKKGYFDRFDL
jgi:RNA polymerase sigma factor (sigma-70 family)